MKIQIYTKDLLFLLFINKTGMKKKIKIALIVFFGVFAIYNFLLYPTGLFVVYNNPTIANDPGIKMNSKTLGTNLITSKNGDFVCYKFNDLYVDKHVRVHRQVAKENDTLKIVEGVLIVNSKTVDDNLNLRFNYEVTEKKFKEIQKMPNVNNDVYSSVFFNKGSVLLSLTNEFIRQNKLKLVRLKDSVNHFDETIYKLYKEKWNKDNFGPLIIPENKIFVLGDNRDNTFDSRTGGLIDVNDLVGVLFKIF